MRRFWSYTAVACVGTLGLMTSFGLPSSLEEVQSAVAAELIGGAACSNWKMAECPKASEATTACPLSNVWKPGTRLTNYAPSGSEWCGCTKSCNNEEHVKGIYKCGSGGGGPYVAVPPRSPRIFALIR
jgi:hypothetical protein